MDNLKENGALRPVIQAVEAVLRRKDRAVLVLDGMSAAGKTTGAEQLSSLWHAPVVHMDDFFLPAELRFKERLGEPGGNVHYERFCTEVLPGLSGGKGFSYAPFQCSAMAYGAPVDVPAAAVTIVEGAYAMHPRFGGYWDVSVFFGISAAEQKRRILLRSGAGAWENFRTRWIPMENAYHEAYKTQQRADITVGSEL